MNFRKFTVWDNLLGSIATVSLQYYTNNHKLWKNGILSKKWIHYFALYFKLPSEFGNFTLLCVYHDNCSKQSFNKTKVHVYVYVYRKRGKEQVSNSDYLFKMTACIVNGSLNSPRDPCHNKRAPAVFFKTVSCNLYKISILQNNF